MKRKRSRFRLISKTYLHLSLTIKKIKIRMLLEHFNSVQEKKSEFVNNVEKSWKNLEGIQAYRMHRVLVLYIAKVKGIRGRSSRLDCRKSSNYIARAYRKNDDIVYRRKYSSFVRCSLQEPENSSRNPLSSVTRRCGSKGEI